MNSKYDDGVPSPEDMPPKNTGLTEEQLKEAKQTLQEFTEELGHAIEKGMAADYQHWGKRDLWEIRNAAQLLAGLNPVEDPEVYSRSVYTEGDHGIKVRAPHEKFALFKNIMGIAKEAIEIETLKPFRNAEKHMPWEDMRVFPKDFLAWAKSKDFDIHEELSYLLESEGAKDTEAESPTQEIEGVSSSPSGKREKQLQFITKVISSFGYDPLAIPYSGKAKIKERCNKEYSIFDGEYSFDHAWKEARKRELVQMEAHDTYSK